MTARIRRTELFRAWHALKHAPTDGLRDASGNPRVAFEALGPSGRLDPGDVVLAMLNQKVVLAPVRRISKNGKRVQLACANRDKVIGWAWRSHVVGIASPNPDDPIAHCQRC